MTTTFRVEGYGNGTTIPIVDDWILPVSTKNLVRVTEDAPLLCHLDRDTPYSHEDACMTSQLLFGSRGQVTIDIDRVFPVALYANENSELVGRVPTGG